MSLIFPCLVAGSDILLLFNRMKERKKDDCVNLLYTHIVLKKKTQQTNCALTEHLIDLLKMFCLSKGGK